MNEQEFALRLAQLREQKGISAREMSLAIGQNPGYINNIENGKAFPSMTVFFYICEYLSIPPKDFFDTEAKFPQILLPIFENMKKLSEEHLLSLDIIVKGLIK